MFSENQYSLFYDFVEFQAKLGIKREVYLSLKNKKMGI